mmetsp:Transcript_864/g.2777  ORF Transcript_864/g.2777 Transcript_864/m.2777 type:complete len:320 (-) Transcript_864:117-1076(-)
MSKLIGVTKKVLLWEAFVNYLGTRMCVPFSKDDVARIAKVCGPQKLLRAVQRQNARRTAPLNSLLLHPGIRLFQDIQRSHDALIRQRLDDVSSVLHKCSRELSRIDAFVLPLGHTICNSHRWIQAVVPDGEICIFASPPVISVHVSPHAVVQSILPGYRTRRYLQEHLFRAQGGTSSVSLLRKHLKRTQHVCVWCDLAILIGSDPVLAEERPAVHLDFIQEPSRGWPGVVRPDDDRSNLPEVVRRINHKPVHRVALELPAKQTLLLRPVLAALQCNKHVRRRACAAFVSRVHAHLIARSPLQHQPLNHLPLAPSSAQHS